MMLADNQAILWQESFEEQIAHDACNTAPVEALVRTVSYWLRGRYTVADYPKLRFLEMGCGAGANLLWLARKGIRVSGIDLAPNALALARTNFARAGCVERVDELVEGSVAATPFPDASFDGVIEACVFQHLDRADRIAAFREVGRLLKPGGIFAGYMLDAGHTIYQKKGAQEGPDDPGTLVLEEGGSKFYLSNIGLSHFFRREEFDLLLSGFDLVDPCLATYFLPREEARKRGYDVYLQSMWAVYARR